jgi:hypothetical protein
MSREAVIFAGVLTTLAVCGLAALKGGPSEKAAGRWIAATWMAVVVAERTIGRDQLPLVILCADGVLATALLFISIQYASLWMGGAMLLQSGAFALHAWYQTELPLDRNVYLLAVSLLGYAVLALLLAATLSRWARRLRRRKDPGERARPYRVGQPRSA